MEKEKNIYKQKDKYKELQKSKFQFEVKWPLINIYLIIKEN